MRHRLVELILLFWVCLAPWAYGSVEAWAELGLYVGVAILTVLSLNLDSGVTLRARLCGLPSLALGGLVLFACFQATPLSARVLAGIAPATAALRSMSAPLTPERVLGDAAPIPLPAWTLSLDPDSTLQTAARLAAAWLLFQGVLGLRGGSAVLTRFAQAVVVNAVLLSLFAIVQALAWNGCIYWTRPAPVVSGWSAGGPFLSHNHLAAYLNLGLGLALGMLFHGGRRDFLRPDSTKSWIVYATAIIAAGVVVSHSRSGFLGMLVAGLCFAFFARRRLAHLGPALIVVLATTGLFLAFLASSSSYGSRLSTILDLADQGYQVRLEVWRAALRAWWERPLWGAGLGNFALAVLPQLEQNRAIFFARAENEYIDLLLEGGAVGWLLAIAFLVGIGRLARRAILGACDSRERCLIGGAVFGLIALSVQSFADFAPHIPAIGVTAIVICAQIARLGQSAEAPRLSEASGSLEGPVRAPQIGTVFAWLGSVILSVVLVGHGISDARVEDQLAAAGLSAPGVYMATVWTDEASSWELDDWRDSLETALRLRPNWAEGHLRLGLVHLGLYRLTAREWVEDSGSSDEEIHRMTDPLALLGAVHGEPSTATDGPEPRTNLLQFDPVRQHLVPAARCFLQARRCSPAWSLPNAELASVDYLLVRGSGASVYVARALGRAGGDGLLMMFLAQIAAQVGDQDLAARCWRKVLIASPSNWTEIADAATRVLSPEVILRDIVVDGRSAIRFADHLYNGPKDHAIRDDFHRFALDRLASDNGITAAERLYLEARALAGLDQTERATQRMAAALELDPLQAAWREEYIEWLIQSGRLYEAHAQAIHGINQVPAFPVFRAAVDRTAEALARGGDTPLGVE